MWHLEQASGERWECADRGGFQEPEEEGRETRGCVEKQGQPRTGGRGISLVLNGREDANGGGGEAGERPERGKRLAASGGGS